RRWKSPAGPPPPPRRARRSPPRRRRRSRRPPQGPRPPPRGPAKMKTCTSRRWRWRTAATRRTQSASTGARRAPAAARPPSGEAATVDVGELGGLNALVAAANPVLAVAAQIRHALKHPDPQGLRASLRRSIDAFENTARGAGASGDTVAAASHALAALVEESV